MTVPPEKRSEHRRGDRVSRAFGDAQGEVAGLKATLARRIVDAFDEQRLTVRGAEKQTGIDAADFSRIRKAKLERFTIDRLMTILSRLNQEIEVTVTSRAPANSAGRMAAPRLDGATTRATEAFMRRLEGRYPVREGILYGSRARQTHRADSDADVAVVLKGRPQDRAATARDLAGIAFDVLMETGVLVEALPLWVGELKHPDRFSNPALIRNIQRDGLRL